MDAVTGKEASPLILLVLIVAACDERLDPIRDSAWIIPCLETRIQREKERSERVSGRQKKRGALQDGNRNTPSVVLAVCHGRWSSRSIEVEMVRGPLAARLVIESHVSVTWDCCSILCSDMLPCRPGIHKRTGYCTKWWFFEFLVSWCVFISICLRRPWYKPLLRS